MESAKIQSLRGKLLQVLDRQQRAENAEEWFADQSSIEKTLAEMEAEGLDRVHELEQAQKGVDELNKLFGATCGWEN